MCCVQTLIPSLDPRLFLLNAAMLVGGMEGGTIYLTLDRSISSLFSEKRIVFEDRSLNVLFQVCVCDLSFCDFDTV